MGCQANYQVSEYISLVGLMVFAFGIGFEFPVLLVFLQLVGVLTPQIVAQGVALRNHGDFRDSCSHHPVG